MSGHEPVPRILVGVDRPLGCVAVVLGVVLLVTGCAAAWRTDKRDDGYTRADTARVSTPTAALVSERITVDGARDPGVDWSGTVRISVRGAADTSVFAGVAHYEDAVRYLDGVAYSRVVLDRVTEHDDRHAQVHYQRAEGDAGALPAPADETFWVASALGAGWQALFWEPSDGDWLLVVAGVDGSPGVHATVRVGMRSPMPTGMYPLYPGTRRSSSNPVRCR